MNTRYLIKFVSDLERAEELLSGKCFMRSSKRVRPLPSGDADCSGSHSITIYLNGRWTVCCTYAVNADDVDFVGNIRFPKRIISERRGYALVLDRSLLPSADGFTQKSPSSRLLTNLRDCACAVPMENIKIGSDEYIIPRDEVKFDKTRLKFSL